MEKKEQEYPVKIAQLYYLYFALLPFLAFASLYFEKDVWQQFTQFINSENESFYFLYHGYCAITFFVTAILSLVLIQNTPLPKNKWTAIIIIFDAPIFMLIDYYTGNNISIAEMAIYDFVLEILAFTLAELVLSFKSKSTFFIGYWGIALILTFYGAFAFRILEAASLKSLTISVVTFISAISGYYLVLKDKKGGIGIKHVDNTIQISMSKVGTVIMFGTWALIAYVYFVALFID